MYTNFCPFDAHRFFPCFDQPDIKATYLVKVKCPEDYTVISNAPALVDNVSDGRRTVEFEESKLMSTYIFSVIVGPFVYFEDVYQKQGFNHPTIEI